MEGGFGPEIIFTIPGTDIPVTETVTNTWIIMAILILFSFLATRKFAHKPKGLQNFVELLVDGIYKFTAQTMGEDKVAFAPYIGTLMIYLIFANLAGLFAIRPPTADLNTTMGLALITFFMIHFFAIKRKGVGTYLKGFLDPFPALLVINIIGELATPISLSFRLFGNIVGGLIIMNLLYGGLAALSGSIGLPIPILQAAIPAPLHIYFDVFAGVLQSFIFAMLTMVFVSIAMD
ncbi:F0F1 ATP synthase subunit A [Marinisporobacter balticus]|uniref:ATP synthase subunit a n=1 Tax=Marinisporobacter balticus TaxID=2018667 RepID=A0A4R2LHI9_9FIRM|nr:F0F1 ATP synthase subunit A [Marinisporobacter balticus]TCO78795.1 ATP synthase F0 subcomplex A subunit [Marinisporobacter balticus]